MPDDVIKIAIEAVDNATATLNKVKDSLEKLGESGVDAGKKADEGAKGFESFAGKLVAVQAGIGIAKEAIAGLKEVWDFAKEGAANQQIAASFERTAKSIGGNADEILKKLDAASKGTIDDEALMQASTRALTLGVAKSGDDLVRVMELSRAAALAFGGDAGQAFETINYAIGNLAPRALKQYGIIVSLSDSYKEYAAAIGKSADQLTEEEQRQALLNTVLEQGKKTFGDLSSTVATTAEKMQAVETRMRNIVDSVKEFMATGISTGFTISEAPQKTQEAFTATMMNMRKEVAAGRMSLEDYNDAITGMASNADAAIGMVMTPDMVKFRLSVQYATEAQVEQWKEMQNVTAAAAQQKTEMEALALVNKRYSDQLEAAKPTNLSAMTPEAQQAATTAYKSYQSKITDIEVKGDDERAKAVGEAMDKLATLETDSGQKRSDIISQFTADEVGRLSDLRDKRIDILMNYSANEQKITEQQNKDRLKLAQSYGIETERMEQDHQIAMQRMTEDHTRNLRKLADSRDALGIEDEQASYQVSRRRAEEDYQLQAGRRSEDYARQLAEQNASFEEQRKQRADDRDKQLVELQKQFDKQDAKYKTAYTKQLADLDKQTEAQRQVIWAAEEKKMSDLATAQAAEVTAANAEWTQWRNEHAIFFAGEKALYDDYLKHMHDQLQAYINNAGVTPSAAPPATTPTHAPGAGYAAGGAFTVPSGYSNDTYPFRVSSGEHVRVTPAGKSSGIPAITITQTFNGAQSEPEKYKAIVYQVITDVMEKAMRQ